jgi:hypothetical protein
MGALAIAVVLGVVAVVAVFVLGGSESPSGGQPARTAAIPTEPAISSLPQGGIEPGRYVFASSDPQLDASYRITIDVPEGYDGAFGVAAIGVGFSQTSVSTLAISDVYADGCRWEESLLDRSEISTTDEVVAALESQEGLRVSTPTTVSVDGFAGTYMERTVPAGTDVSRCDLGQFRVYLASEFGERFLVRGQLQQLWILDIDGVPLVIDASVEPGTPSQVRAELRQMVESIRIEPH